MSPSSAPIASRTVAWCRLDDEPEGIALTHGDWIGRTHAATLLVDDSRISEAHAMVSLRGGRLVLLGLRGRFRVHGRVLAEVVLEPGLRVELAAGRVLTVERVELPQLVLGLTGEGLAPFVLPGTVSVDLGPPPRVRPGWQPDADLVLWSVDDAWRCSIQGGPAQPVAIGDRLQVGALAFTAVGMPIGSAGAPRTVTDLAAPLRLTASFHTVQVRVGGAAPVVIGGQSGRLLSELVELAGPVEWTLVADELWGPAANADAHRRRWDVALSRLRSRLRAVGVRTDLVSTDGTGKVELLLRDGDRAEVVG